MTGVMARSTVWALSGTSAQTGIVAAALDRCDFPFHRLVPGLVAEAGREVIPVEWADLSRYATAPGEATAHHVHEDGDTAHTLAPRGRVLGLAWYSGRVSLDVSLEGDPELAAEVFLSEGAHMVDFFYLTDVQRARVWNAFHPEGEDVDPSLVLEDGREVAHGHSWFDVGDYYTWAGEAFMGGFVRAFSDVPVTIEFIHRADAQAAAEIRHVLLNGQMWYFGLEGSETYHDWHRRIPREVEWPSREDAEADGRRPCGVCRPG